MAAAVAMLPEVLAGLRGAFEEMGKMFLRVGTVAYEAAAAMMSLFSFWTDAIEKSNQGKRQDAYALMRWLDDGGAR